MHYVVEIRTSAGGWLRRRQEFKLLTDAQLEAERVRREGGVPRLVQVTDEGTRKVMR